MSYTKEYKGSKADKDALAIEDVKFWLSDNSRFEMCLDTVASILITGWAKGHKMSQIINTARFGLAFAGIQGYPVLAVMRAVLGSGWHLVTVDQPRTPIASGKLYPLFKHAMKLANDGFGTKEDYTFRRIV